MIEYRSQLILEPHQAKYETKQWLYARMDPKFPFCSVKLVWGIFSCQFEKTDFLVGISGHDIDWSFLICNYNQEIVFFFFFNCLTAAKALHLLNHIVFIEWSLGLRGVLESTVIWLTVYSITSEYAVTEPSLITPSQDLKAGQTDTYCLISGWSVAVGHLSIMWTPMPSSLMSCLSIPLPF